jgi:beta-xylosidase
VFTAARPTGPFHEAPVPHLHGPGADPAGINGDENLFVDTDGTTYVIYTDWRTYGGLVVERLNRSATSGAGPHSRLPVHGAEAPSLFVREKRYFVTYSDPPCGYCARTGTSYAVARSPLGPWFKRRRVSADSCGGQPTMVTALGTRRDATFLYQSDLWDGGNANQFRANYYWGPLRFTSRETLARLRCLREWKLP